MISDVEKLIEYKNYIKNLTNNKKSRKNNHSKIVSERQIIKRMQAIFNIYLNYLSESIGLYILPEKKLKHAFDSNIKFLKKINLLKKSF